MTTPSSPRAILLTAACALLAGGCSGGGSNGVGDDTGTANQPFCYIAADADTHYIDAGGGAGASGKLFGLLLTDRAEDLHDPNFVAYVEYTLESVDFGGSQLIGESSPEGDFVETLGAGTWRIQVADSKMGYTCQNTYEFDIAAGDTTFLCLDMACK